MPNPNSKLMDVASQAFSAAEESPAEACRTFLKLCCAHNFGPAPPESARCTTFPATLFFCREGGCLGPGRSHTCGTKRNHQHGTAKRMLQELFDNSSGIHPALLRMLPCVQDHGDRIPIIRNTKKTFQLYHQLRRVADFKQHRPSSFRIFLLPFIASKREALHICHICRFSMLVPSIRTLQQKPSHAATC